MGAEVGEGAGVVLAFEGGDVVGGGFKASVGHAMVSGTGSSGGGGGNSEAGTGADGSRLRATGGGHFTAFDLALSGGKVTPGATTLTAIPAIGAALVHMAIGRAVEVASAAGGLAEFGEVLSAAGHFAGASRDVWAGIGVENHGVGGRG